MDPIYRIEQEIEKGGQAAIYRGKKIEEDGTETIVAMKKYVQPLPKKKQESMERELKILKHLKDHCRKYILCYDNFISRTDYYERVDWIVTEYIEFPTLDDLIYDFPEPTIANKIKLMLSLTRAVKYIHKFGIIHRDLKPENIMVDDNDFKKVKIIDFGLSCFEGDKYCSVQAGTFAYMDPYLVYNNKNDKIPLGSQIDVFSLGRLFIAILMWNAYPLEDDYEHLLSSPIRFRIDTNVKIINTIIHNRLQLIKNEENSELINLISFMTTVYDEEDNPSFDLYLSRPSLEEVIQTLKSII